MNIWDEQGQFIATPAVSVSIAKTYYELCIKQSKVTDEIQKRLGFDDEWLLVHRVDIHSALRRIAEAGFDGRQPKIHLGYNVTSVVRPEQACSQELVCADGRTRTPPMGKSCFRTDDSCKLTWSSAPTVCM